MLQFIDRFLTVPSADPDDSRKRKILNILLAGTGAVAIIGILASVSLLIVSPQYTGELSLILWAGSATLVGVALTYLVNYFFSGRVAAFLFLAILNIVFVFTDTPEQLTNGRSLFIFTIPIFMASILLTPTASFIFWVISSALISWLGISIGYAPNVPAIIGFSLVAIVSWLSARSLEQALGELRVINLNLDRVIAERTQALAESLSRERIEAGRSQAILNSIADGVIVFDKKWTATLANPALKALLDIPLELIVNKNFRELIEHPRMSTKSRGLLHAMMNHGTQPIGFRIEWSDKTLSVGAANVPGTLTALDATQLSDGPWCPDEDDINRYDADLHRVQQIRVTFRVQTSVAILRGPAGVLFSRAGTGRLSDRLVPDQAVQFDVTPRNLNLGR